MINTNTQTHTYTYGVCLCIPSSVCASLRPCVRPFDRVSVCACVCARAGTYPPLLVLLPRHHYHLPLGEGELVIVVCLAVVDGLHAPRLGLALQPGGEVTSLYSTVSPPTS